MRGNSRGPGDRRSDPLERYTERYSDIHLDAGLALMFLPPFLFILKNKGVPDREFR